MMNLAGRLRQHYPKLYFLLVALINTVKKALTPYSIYITDSLGGSFKTYAADSDLDKKISALRKNLDKESTDTIDVVIQRLLKYPDESQKYKISKHGEIIGGLLPVEMKHNRKVVEEYLRSLTRKLKFPSKHIEESVFYYHHGLSLMPQNVAEYIKDQDFIDIGAFIGDSAIALKLYQYRKIYSIEMSGKSVEKYKINMTENSITADRFEIINLGIASNDKEDPVKINDTGSSGLSFLRKSGKYDEITVERKSLDFIVEKYKIKPRFIKVDIEGNGLEFVKGAQKTLIDFRPVLSVAIYHNPYEFFEVKPFLEDLQKDYIFMIRKLATGIKNNLCHSEVVLLGYPKEIID